MFTQYSSDCDVFCTVVAINPVLSTKYKKEIHKDGSRMRKCVNTLKLMLVFVSLTSLLFLILQRCAKFLYENRQNFIQRVHHSSLEPFGNGGPGVMKSKLLQDIVHSDRVNLTASPRDQPETRITTHHIITGINTHKCYSNSDDLFGYEAVLVNLIITVAWVLDATCYRETLSSPLWCSSHPLPSLSSLMRTRPVALSGSSDRVEMQKGAGRTEL